MKSIKTKLIVANTGSDSLTIVDLNDKFKAEEINLGKKHIGPHSLMQKDKKHIYSVNCYDSSIYTINLETGAVDDIAQVGRFPTHMEIVNEHIYVVNSDSNSVTILDKTNLNIIGNISVGEKPHDIKLDKKRNKVFITNHNGYSIYSIDLDKNIESEICLENNPFHLKIIDDSMFILLHPNSKSEYSHIKMINFCDQSIRDIISLHGTIVDMEIIYGTSIIYITNAEDGFLYEVDCMCGIVKNKYKIGKMLNNIVCSDDLLYITDTENDKVVIFSHSNKRILSEIKVGREPSGLLLI